jgi:hypothetical protein
MRVAVVLASSGVLHCALIVASLVQHPDLQAEARDHR